MLPRLVAWLNSFSPADQLERFRLAAMDLDGHHAAEAGHLRGGDFVAGMRRQAGIVHGFDLRLPA